jgi:hypothetical protein
VIEPIPNSTHRFHLVLEAATKAEQLSAIQSLIIALASDGRKASVRSGFELWPMRHAAHDRFKETLRELGRIHRCYNLDPAAVGPLWDLVLQRAPFTVRAEYVSEYERGRVVELERFSPAAIFEGLQRRNRLRYDGYEIFCADDFVTVDDYGMDRSATRVILSHPTGKTTEYRIHAYSARREARRIFRAVTGLAFFPNDQLGEDLPYPQDGLGYVPGMDSSPAA